MRKLCLNSNVNVSLLKHIMCTSFELITFFEVQSSLFGTKFVDVAFLALTHTMGNNLEH